MACLYVAGELVLRKERSFVRDASNSIHDNDYKRKNQVICESIYLDNRRNRRLSNTELRIPRSRCNETVSLYVLEGSAFAYT